MCLHSGRWPVAALSALFVLRVAGRVSFHICTPRRACARVSPDVSVRSCTFIAYGTKRHKKGAPWFDTQSLPGVVIVTIRREKPSEFYISLGTTIRHAFLWFDAFGSCVVTGLPLVADCFECHVPSVAVTLQVCSSKRQSAFSLFPKDAGTNGTRVRPGSLPQARSLEW